ncbi:MAG: NAD(P)/FAD-dependent oxidoreductase [Methanoregulaceae archaeon]
MEICIIGGGLSGLSAAYSLSRNHSVNLIEKDAVLGGCLSSYSRGHYFIEKYYHHCFPSDTTLFRLLAELDLSQNLEWRSGSTGYYADAKIYPLTSPSDIIRYPFLTFADKAKLAFLTIRSKRMDTASLDDITAKEFILRQTGKSAYESFFEPLLRSKFGARSDEVSAAWLISRIAIRSHRGISGERLGYLNGGFQRLIDVLEAAARKNQCTISKGTEVTSLIRKNGSWQVNGTPYDAVLATIPVAETSRLGGPAIKGPQYQGAACMALGLERDVTEGVYWVNMKDPAPYGAVISHTNFIPKDRYGEHIVYLASYFTGAPADNLEEKMLSDFRTRFQVAENEIHWHDLAIDPWAGPIYVTGSRKTIPPYEQNGLYLAGMFSEPNYPERSIEGSIRAGLEAAQRILSTDTI